MFTTKCASCTETVGDGPDCSVCKNKFHFSCGGISERGFSRLGANRASWMCTNCRDSSLAGLDVSKVDEGTTDGEASGSKRLSSGLALEKGTPLSSKSMDAEGQVVVSSPTFLTMLNEISSKITMMQSQLGSIQTIQQDIQLVKSDIADLKTTVNSRLDEFSARINDIESTLSIVESCRTEVDELKAQVKELLDGSHKNEQWVAEISSAQSRSKVKCQYGLVSKASA